MLVHRWFPLPGCLLILALALGAQEPAKKAQKPPQKTGEPVEEDPNVGQFKYNLAQNIERLLPPEFSDRQAKAAQELANMKIRAAELSLMQLFKKDAIPALEAALKDSEKSVREEAALALKRIRDDAPYPKVSRGGQWVQLLRVKRGGESGFEPRQSSDVLLEVHMKTNDPNIASVDFMDGKSPKAYCEVLYPGSAEPLPAGYGGGSFRDRSEKMCGFAVPQEARGLKFRLKGFPEIDLRF